MENPPLTLKKIISDNSSLFSNKPLLGAVLLTFILQFVATYTPTLHPIFKTQALTFYEFLGVGAASSLIFFGVEIEKAISRKRISKKMKTVL